MAAATRQEALEWCIENNADFQTAILPAPGGWMWAEEKDALVLVAVFTLVEPNHDITKNDVEDYRKTMPAYVSEEEARIWVEQTNLTLDTIPNTIPPRGWHYAKTSTSHYFLAPIASHVGPTPIELQLGEHLCQD